MRNKCLIIFTGFNQRAVIAFIRTIEFHNIKYALIAKSENDPILISLYKDKVAVIRQTVPLDLNDILNSIKQVRLKYCAEEYVIAPSTEALNRFLLKNRALIEQHNVTVPLVSLELYESISDKYSFGRICKENNIKVPHEYFDINKTAFPFVAKPKKYISGDCFIYSPYIIMDDEERQIFLKKCKPEDFYFQEFIQGNSYYLLYYFHRNGEIYKFSQLNVIQQPGGKSIVAAVSSNYHNSNESFKYEELFKSLKFYGLIMVEVKRGKEDSYMIEANPRFWGPSQLFVDAKVNFFEGFLHDYGFLDSCPKFTDTEEEHKYFWFGGIIEALRSEQNVTFNPGKMDDLIIGLPEWLSIDVYRRPDTIDIFKTELS